MGAPNVVLPFGLLKTVSVCCALLNLEQVGAAVI